MDYVLLARTLEGPLLPRKKREHLYKSAFFKKKNYRGHIVKLAKSTTPSLKLSFFYQTVNQGNPRVQGKIKLTSMMKILWTYISMKDHIYQHMN